MSFERVKALFVDYFDEESIDESTSMENFEDWDSMSHINILGMIEEEFKVEVPLEKAGELTSVKSIVSFLDQKS